MKIEKNSAVTLRMKMSEVGGKATEQSNDHVAYLHGGYDNIFPKLEQLLDGQEVGFKTSIDLQPADAFGIRDPELAISIPKSEFPPGVKVGGQLEVRGADGQFRQYYVVKVKGDKVLLDGNHPMAGKTLRLAVTVQEVRPASDDEITHGHVHGTHGHHH